jgi:hypothetical protein
MANPTLDYATRSRPTWFTRLAMGSAAGVIGLITSFIGLVAAGHGGPIWPAAVLDGPWVGPVWLLDRIMDMPSAAFLSLHFGAGILGYVGYVYVLLGPLRRFGYLRGCIIIATFHCLGIAWSLAMGWWLIP